jgi:hypothetical protein
VPFIGAMGEGDSLAVERWRRRHRWPPVTPLKGGIVVGKGRQYGTALLRVGEGKRWPRGDQTWRTPTRWRRLDLAKTKERGGGGQAGPAVSPRPKRKGWSARPGGQLGSGRPARGKRAEKLGGAKILGEKKIK